MWTSPAIIQHHEILYFPFVCLPIQRPLNIDTVILAHFNLTLTHIIHVCVVQKNKKNMLF